MTINFGQLVEMVLNYPCDEIVGGGWQAFKSNRSGFEDFRHNWQQITCLLLVAAQSRYCSFNRFDMFISDLDQPGLDQPSLLTEQVYTDLLQRAKKNTNLLVFLANYQLSKYLMLHGHDEYHQAMNDLVSALYKSNVLLTLLQRLPTLLRSNDPLERRHQILTRNIVECLPDSKPNNRHGLLSWFSNDKNKDGDEPYHTWSQKVPNRSLDDFHGSGTEMVSMAAKAA